MGESPLYLLTMVGTKVANIIIIPLFVNTTKSKEALANYTVLILKKRLNHLNNLYL